MGHGRPLRFRIPGANHLYLSRQPSSVANSSPARGESSLALHYSSWESGCWILSRPWTVSPSCCEFMWSIFISILCMFKRSSWFWSLAYRSILLLICLLSSCFMWAQDLLSSAPYECWYPRFWLGLVTAISFLCHSGRSFKISYFKIVKQLIFTKASGNVCLQLEENQYSKCLCVSIIHMLE